jgi:hypothetical protein
VRPGQEPEKEPRRLREPLVVVELGRLVGIWSGGVAALWLRVQEMVSGGLVMEGETVTGPRLTGSV